MILNDIFVFLNNTGQARSHAIFSTDYLGHSARYYDYLRCSGARPSLRSLMKAALHLFDIAKVSGHNSEDSHRATALAQRAMLAALDRCR